MSSIFLSKLIIMTEEATKEMMIDSLMKIINFDQPHVEGEERKAFNKANVKPGDLIKAVDAICKIKGFYNDKQTDLDDEIILGLA